MDALPADETVKYHKKMRVVPCKTSASYCFPLIPPDTHGPHNLSHEVLTRKKKSTHTCYGTGNVVKEQFAKSTGWPQHSKENTTYLLKTLWRLSLKTSQWMQDKNMMLESGTFDGSNRWAIRDDIVQDTRVELNGIVDNPPSITPILQTGQSSADSSPTGGRSGGVRRIKRLSDASVEDTINGRIDEIRGADGTFGNVLVASDSTTKFRESLNHSRQVRRASKGKLVNIKHLECSSRDLVSSRGTRSDGVTLRRIGSAPSLTSTKHRRNKDQQLPSTMDPSVPAPPMSPRIIIGTKRRMRRGSLTSKAASSPSAEEAFHNSFSSLDYGQRNTTKSSVKQQKKCGKGGTWDPNFSLDNVRDFNSGQGGFSRSIAGLEHDPLFVHGDKHGSPVDDVFLVNTEPRRRQNRRSSMSGRINYSREGEHQSSISEPVIEYARRKISGTVACEVEGSEWKNSSTKSPNAIHADKKSDVDDIAVSAFGMIGSNGGFKESPLDYGFKLKDFGPDLDIPNELSSLVRAKRSKRRHSLHNSRTTTSLEANEQISSSQHSQHSSNKSGRLGRALQTRRGSSGSLSVEVHSEHSEKNNSELGEQRQSKARSSIPDDGEDFSSKKVGTSSAKKKSERIKQFFRLKSERWLRAVDGIGSVQSGVLSPADSAATRRPRRRGSLGSNVAAIEQAHVQAKVEGSPVLRRNHYRSSISSHGSANDLKEIKRQENVINSPRRRRGSLSSYSSMNDLQDKKLQNVVKSPRRRRGSLGSHGSANDLHDKKMQRNVVKSPRKRRGSLKSSTNTSAIPQQAMVASSARDRSDGTGMLRQKAKPGDSKRESWEESPGQQSRNISISPYYVKPVVMNSSAHGTVSPPSSSKATPSSSRARRRRSSGKNNEDYITRQKRSQSPPKSSQRTRRRSSLGDLSYQDGKSVRGSEGPFFGEEFNDGSTQSMSSFDTDAGGQAKIDIRRTELLLRAVAT